MNEHRPATSNPTSETPGTSRNRGGFFGILDAVWLIVLAVYILGGIAIVPFHGDEAMQMTMSRDYFTAFVNHQPHALLVNPPYQLDSPNWLRLINGSVNPHTVGFSLHLAGYIETGLPAIWEWPLSYDENVLRGHRPPQAMLIVSRLPSAIFLALSVIILFGIGRQMRGRVAAYTASGLYALSPVILLNGRRAMMEGSVLCFGLLAIWLAIMICKGRDSWRWWIALGLACGLTLASKHSGIVFVAAALGWVLVGQITKHFPILPIRLISHLLGRLMMSLVMMMIIFIALSPGLWNAPLARLGDLVTERTKLLDSQVKAEPDAPTTLNERVIGIVTQPYVQAPVYYEAAFWANAEPIQVEIAAYDPSVWSGLHSGALIGTLLTLVAVMGIGIIARDWRMWRIGLLVWLTVTLASLLVNPLPWQRYYLSLYPLAALLTGIGATALTRRWSQRRSSA